MNNMERLFKMLEGDDIMEDTLQNYRIKMGKLLLELDSAINIPHQVDKREIQACRMYRKLKALHEDVCLLENAICSYRHLAQDIETSPEILDQMEKVILTVM